MRRIISLFLFIISSMYAVDAQPLLRNYFTTNQNPQVNFTNGNLVSTNIYVSNLFVTNLTANFVTNLNQFNGRTTITTNLFVSNAFFTNLTVDVITNNTFIATNAYISNAFITNLFVDNIVTNSFTTNLTVNNLTVNTNAYITNLFGPFITNYTLYSTNIISTNIITTNLFATFITNETLYTTNLVTDFITVQSNATFNITTNNFLTVNSNATFNSFTSISNAYITNITFVEAQATTNAWNGPTNNVNFTTGTYQKFKATTDMEITGFQGSVPTNENTTVLLIDPNGSDRTLYFPNNWTNYTLDRANAYVIGSTNIAIVTLSQYGQENTNVIVRLFGVIPSAAVTSIQASGPAGFTWSGGPITSSGTLTATTPGLVLTNGENQITTFSNRLTVDAAHSLYVSNMTAVGVVTNDANGQLLTTPTLPSTLLPNDLAFVDKNNAFTTASSNYIAMTVTTSTNQNQIKPDFSVAEQLISTNAAFTFLAPVGVDTTKTTAQWTLVNVTNTTAAAVLITSPANCHTVGTAYVTNLTAVWFQCYAQKFTNAFYIPIF